MNTTNTVPPIIPIDDGSPQHALEPQPGERCLLEVLMGRADECAVYHRVGMAYAVVYRDSDAHEYHQSRMEDALGDFEAYVSLADKLDSALSN